MKVSARSNVRFFLRGDHGQALPVICFMMVSLLALAGIVIDIGHAYFAYRELQASTDAAALAGAKALPASNAVSTATLYSGVSGNYNVQANLPNVTMVAGYPKVMCLTTLQKQGMACVAPANGNAVMVKQTVSVPMYFLSVIGKKTMTMSTTATAAMRGGTPTPYNIVILMDSTLSMNINDSNCGNVSQMTCALNGVQILLQSLTPCAMSLSSCTITNGVSANAVDRVALFTFPAMTTETTSIDSTCTTPIPQATNSNGYANISPYGNLSYPGGSQWSGVPTSTVYAYPTVGAASYTPATANGTPVYRLLPFLSDYKTSDSATTLNTNSALVKAAGGVSGCGGMLPPNDDILYVTYYAASIYAAQAALVAQAAANPGTQNVLIILSDGDSNAPQNVQYNGSTYTVMPAPADGSGRYPSYVGECSQAVTAAAAATAAGTHVYSIAYGAPSSGCSTDQNAGYSPNITPCETMAAIASAPQYFFSDYNQSYQQQSNGGSTCQSAAQGTDQISLSQIFAQIASDLTVGRLIPDNTP